MYAKELSQGARLEIHPNIQNSFKTTFGNLDGQALHWPPTSYFRASRRLLALHAARAVREARTLYGYQETGPFPYHASGDVKALAGIYIYTSLLKAVWICVYAKDNIFMPWTSPISVLVSNRRPVAFPKGFLMHPVLVALLYNGQSWLISLICLSPSLMST